MRINLLSHICAAVLLCAVPVFSAEPMLDFDGRGGRDIDLKTFVAENAASSPPWREKAEAELVIKLEVSTESGEWTELKPVKNWVDDNGTQRNQYSIFPGLRLRWSLKCLKQGKWTAKKTYTLRPDQLGGHYHYDTSPPSLSVSSVSLSTSTTQFHSAPSPLIFPEMQGNTTYYYWERYPAFSTRIVERLDAYGACQGLTRTDYINVEVQGLQEMPYGDNYYLDNSQDAGGYHPDAHYGSQKLIDTLIAVANEYRTAFVNSEQLGIQDMSLPWGGVFDLNYDWKEPHYGHTIGADADINRVTIPQENRLKLLEIMCGLTPGVFLERDISGEPPHYHLRVYGGIELRPDNFMGSDERALGCCKGNEVDPDNLEACISARN